MKNNIFYICLFTCIFFITGLVNAEEQKNTIDKKERLVGIPNPAAAYCVKLGYKYETRKGGNGVVIFPDGTECGEWAFFRGRAAEASTDIQLKGGILSYSRSRGLFAGAKLEGAVLAQHWEGDEELYGKKLSAREILLEDKVKMPKSADEILKVLK